MSLETENLITLNTSEKIYYNYNFKDKIKKYENEMFINYSLDKPGNKLLLTYIRKLISIYNPYTSIGYKITNNKIVIAYRCEYYTIRDYSVNQEKIEEIIKNKDVPIQYCFELCNIKDYPPVIDCYEDLRKIKRLVIKNTEDDSLKINLSKLYEIYEINL